MSTRTKPGEGKVESVAEADTNELAEETEIKTLADNPRLIPDPLTGCVAGAGPMLSLEEMEAVELPPETIVEPSE